ncbi:hypothetical protein Phou_098470 [Phytohabitans houttuyneae]|uniref:Uncharacterized protein n=1 Tax=Phytohabitans houttuyneae TaxID=1076126 RepID=A0A6V8KV34_9ACTN|nr:hypothetical protein Phou_098470 [Phytohabitans houttuyneae]
MRAVASPLGGADTGLASAAAGETGTADTGAGDTGPAGDTGGAVARSERSIDTSPVGSGDVGAGERG